MRVERVTNLLPQHGGVSRCRLRVVGGADAGLEVVIPAVGVVVGADAGADVVLADAAVSARHCSIVPGDSGFEVHDLDSKNGTFLDGTALGRAQVPVGSLLRLGHSLVQLLPAEQTVEIAPSDADHFGDLVGASLPMRRAYGLLERASDSDASILLLGESGTGKELAARAVHEASARARGPFVVFDCGAASDTLIASDLFGHVRGAFTGAHQDRPGAFASAHQGTLFLDEIGDLPLELQPKLLRLLERGEVTPLGAQRAQHYDVRIIAATHHNLWQDVQDGSFRADLYYRLAVVEVALPPLRRRGTDVAVLVKRFLEQLGSDVDPACVGGPQLERLLGYPWPGNVRELRNVVARAVALAPPGADFSELPLLLRLTGAQAGAGDGADAAAAVQADRPFAEAKAEHVEAFERAYLEDLLGRARGNLSQAARIAGVERKYLYRLLDRHGLRPRRDDTGSGDPA